MSKISVQLHYRYVHLTPCCTSPFVFTTTKRVTTCICCLLPFLPCSHHTCTCTLSNSLSYHTDSAEAENAGVEHRNIQSTQSCCHIHENTNDPLLQQLTSLCLCYWRAVKPCNHCLFKVTVYRSLSQTSSLTTLLAISPAGLPHRLASSASSSPLYSHHHQQISYLTDASINGHMS